MTLVPWPDIRERDTAERKPLSPFLTEALAGQRRHVRGAGYDPDVHAPEEAHRHSGVDSAHVFAQPNVPNMLARPVASDDAQWLRHGCEVAAPGFAFAAAGQWATSVLLDYTRPPYALSVFGGGCRLAVSCYLRASDDLTDGLMTFGLTSGEAGQDDDAKTFATGGRVEVPFGLLGTGWKRFWSVLDTATMDLDAAVRFAIQCETAPVGGSVYANLFSVVPGQRLDYWTLGYVSVQTVRVGPLSLTFGLDWEGYGYTPSGGPPAPLDHAIAITDAVQLAAR